MSAIGNPVRAASKPTPNAPEPAQPEERCFPRIAHGAGTTYEVALRRGPEDSRLARQLRRLAEHIAVECPHEHRATILIAGTPPDAHAADVAGLLACEFTGRFGGRTLLVDADGEQKVLTQRFAAVGQPALAEILLNDLPLRRAISQSLVPQLEILPYGDSSPTRRTLEPERVRVLLQGLKRTYSYVIVSGGSCQDAVTKCLARYCDATYMVLQLGKTERQQALATVDFLTCAGARLLGSVATGVT